LYGSGEETQRSAAVERGVGEVNKSNGGPLATIPEKARRKADMRQAKCGGSGDSDKVTGEKEGPSKKMCQKKISLSITLLNSGRGKIIKMDKSVSIWRKSERERQA